MSTEQPEIGRDPEPHFFLGQRDDTTPPATPLTPRPPRSQRSNQSYRSVSRVTIPSWVSMQPRPTSSAAPSVSVQHDTFTESPVSTARPALPDIDNGTEYMTIYPDDDFNPPPPDIRPPEAAGQPSKKRRFAGGFISRLRSLPVAVLSYGKKERAPTRKDTVDTAGSLPMYTETAEHVVDDGINARIGTGFGVGPAISISAPSDEAFHTRPTEISLAEPETIPEEEDEPGPEYHYMPSIHTHRESMPPVQPALDVRPVSNQIQASASVHSRHEPDGDTTIMHHEIRPSMVADLSPKTINPSPASDYDKMELPSELSFINFLFGVARLFRDIYDLPWISNSRVVEDYVPRAVRARKSRPHSTRLKPHWYSASQSTLDLLAEPKPRKRDSSSPASPSPRGHVRTNRYDHGHHRIHGRHRATPHCFTPARPRPRRQSTGTTQHSSQSRPSSGAQSASPRSSHSRQSRSPTYQRYPGGYAPSFAYNAPPQPQPMYVPSGTVPVTGAPLPGWTWAGTATQQAAAMPVFLLAASPTGTFAGLPIQQQQPANNPNPPPAQSSVTSPPSAAGQ